MALRSIRIVAMSCLLALAGSGAGYAQSNDPDAGSPSGTVYEIPLEGGRHDAAPRTGGGSGAADPASPGQGDGAQSPLRSDNGFGSSSTVPGTGQPQAAPPDSGGSDDEAPADPGRSSTGSGTGSKDNPSGKGGDGKDREQPSADEDEVRRGAVVREAAAGSSPSLLRPGLLIALGLLVAVGLTAAARAASRR